MKSIFQMRSIVKYLLAYLVSQFAMTSAHAVDYWVSPSGNDSNSGTQSAPFRTIVRAAAVARAGSTVRVAPGTYNNGRIKTDYSGTATARIRFVSTTKWGAKVVVSGTSYAWLNGASYIDIEGFDLSGSGPGGIFNYGSFVQIKNNYIHNFTWACTNQGGGGIVSGEYNKPQEVDIIGNVVHDIGSYANGCSFIQGIYPQHPKVRIKNNIVYRNAGFGIHLWHAPYSTDISHNLVFNNKSGGIIVGSGDFSYFPVQRADYIRVTNNIVMDNKGYGISECCDSGDTGTHNVYANNLVFRNTNAFRLYNGLQATGTVNADPQFVSYNVNGGGDYHLKPGSPAVNKGTAVAAASADIEGVSRPQGGAYDIGPYEATSQVVNPPANSQVLISEDAEGQVAIEARTSLSGDLRVEFYVNGVKSRTERSAPYCLTAEVSQRCVGGTDYASGTKIEARIYTETGTSVLSTASGIVP